MSTMVFRSWIKKVVDKLMANGGRRSRRSRFGGADRHAERKMRPTLETLEVRVVPANLVVTNVNPSGSGSLPAAVLQANMDGGGDTITFASSLSGQTILLPTPAPSNHGIDFAGTLSITNNVTIIGLGATHTFISGGGEIQVFSIASGVTVSISSVTIENGFESGFGPPYSTGGGIYNRGSLTLSNDTITGNFALSHGGGIYNTGTLTMSYDRLTNNSVGNGFGGGIYNTPTFSTSNGSPVASGGSVSLSNCTVSGNSAPQSGGGINNAGGTLIVTGSTISNNTAGLKGGGISNTVVTSTNGGGLTNVGTVTLSGNTISGNSAFSSGGGIYNLGTLTSTGDTISSNAATHSGQGNGAVNGGGAIVNGALAGNLFALSSATANLTGDTIDNNTAFYTSGAGGGIYNTGTLTLTDSTVSGNSASVPAGNGYGGGILNMGILTVNKSTISNNYCGGGGDPGGVANIGSRADFPGGGLATITDSTISGNTGSYAIGNFSGNLYLTDSTVAFNFGTGVNNLQPLHDMIPTIVDLTNDTVVFNSGSGVANATELQNSIVSGNGYGNGSQDLYGSYSGTNNLISDTTDLAPTLANNGGPTQTVALLPGGTAIGTGESISGITTDQRGISLAIPPDIGAFQLETVTPSSASLPNTATTLTIAGSAFDTTAANDSVTFDHGVTGSVTSATSTSLTVSLTALTNVVNDTALDATVSVDGVSSGSPVEVALVTGPNISTYFYDATQTYGSLQAAINAADASGVANPTITLDGDAVGGVTIGGFTNGTTGTLEITGGYGATITAPTNGTAATPHNALIEDTSGVALELKGLVITGASASPNLTYGVYASGSSTSLTISNSTIQDIGSASQTGSVYGVYGYGGTLTITSSTITTIADEASSFGGIGVEIGAGTSATLMSDTISAYQDVGITVNGATSSATITSTTITGIGGNIGVEIAAGTGAINSSSITDNNNVGILANGAISVTVTNDVLTDDRRGLFNYEGSVTGANDTISGGVDSSGGGLYNYSGTLTLSNSTITDETANIGGGFFNRGTATLGNDTFSNNAANGSNIYNEGTLTLSGINSSGGGIVNVGTLNYATASIKIGATSYGSLQAAINAASGYDPVITITGSAVGGVTVPSGGFTGTLTLAGGVGGTITAPSSADAQSSLISVTTGVSVALLNLTLTGASASPALDYGVYVYGSGTSVSISNSTIEDIGNTSSQTGWVYGVYVADSATLTMTGSTVTYIGDETSSFQGVGVQIGDSALGSGAVQLGFATLENDTINNYQAAGIFVDGHNGSTLSSATIVNCTVTGIGPTGFTPTSVNAYGPYGAYGYFGPDAGDYGILIDDGATGTIEGGIITGNHDTSAGHQSCGIAISNGASANTVTVQNSVVSDNDDGILDYAGTVLICTGDTFDGDNDPAFDISTGNYEIGFAIQDPGGAPGPGYTYLTVTDSYISGCNSGIYSQGNPLTVTGTTICNSVSLGAVGFSDGGIWNQGAGGSYGVVLSNDLLYGNTASDGGGGYSAGWGGYSTITDCQFTNNVSLYGGGGGIYTWFNTYLTVSNSIIANNSAPVGAGIYSAYNGFTVNDAYGADAGLNVFQQVTLSNCTLSGNTASTGGGVVNQGSMTLINCSLTDNSAYAGGGGFNTGQLTLSNTTVSGNSGPLGGGLFNDSSYTTTSGVAVPTGTLALSNSTLSSNFGSTGGGLYNAGVANITNSTVAGNTAVDEYGGVGGGICNFGTVNLTNATVAYNYAGAAGGGIFNLDSTTLTNSIVAANTNGLVEPDDVYNLGTISAAYSLIGNSANSDITTSGNNIVNPGSLGLSTLANNGGLTETIALLPGSPALGAGGGSYLTTDQRGNARGSTADIGAFQLSSADGSTTAGLSSLSLSVSGSTVIATLTFSGSDSGLTSETVDFVDTTINGGVADLPSSETSLGNITLTEVNADTYTATLSLSTLAAFYAAGYPTYGYGGLNAITATYEGDNSLQGSSAEITVANPGLVTSTAALAPSATSMTITGYGFDAYAPNDAVSFNDGVTGSVTAATDSSLTVSVTGLNNVAAGTALDAIVTVDGGGYSSLTPVQVATVAFGVSSVTATPDGFVLTFNGPINSSSTVLYSSPGDTSLGAADVTVTGPSGSVRGSLVIDATDPNVATFVETSGLLASGSYTVTVTTAVKEVGGSTMVGTYSTSLMVTSPTTPVLSVPNFARGPGQTVALSNGTGIPVSISNATGVTEAYFTLTYNPTLLTIAGTGALTLSSTALAAGINTISYTITSVDAYHSVLTVSLTSSSADAGLTANSAVTLVTIAASVPDAAPYTDKAVLNLGSAVVNDFPAAGVSGVDVVAYLGDVLGTGVPDATDASLVDQVGSGAGTGFSTFKDLDPSIIAGIDGGLAVNATDASLINEAASGSSIPQIPTVPSGFSLTFGGPDPYLYLSAVQGAPGQTVTETLYLDVTDPNGIQLTALDEVIAFDAGALQVSDVRGTSALSALGSYATASTVDNGSGEFLVGQAFMGTGLPPVVPYGTDIPVLEFNVTLNADMPLGSQTGLTLLQYGTVNGDTQFTAVSDNEGALTWTPGKAPSNSGNAAVDGTVTAVPASETVVPEAAVSTPVSQRPVVARPKVVEPVKKVTVVSQQVPAAPLTSVSLVVPSASTEIAVATSEIESLPSAVAIVPPDTSAVTAPLIVSTGMATEVVPVASVAMSTTKIADPGASLSLAAVGTNKVASIGSTGTSSARTSTSTLDEMYRQLGALLSAPSGSGNYLGMGGEDTREGMADFWEIEAILADLDASKDSDEKGSQ